MTKKKLPTNIEEYNAEMELAQKQPIATLKKHGILDIGCITEAGGEESVTQRSTRTPGSWL